MLVFLKEGNSLLPIKKKGDIKGKRKEQTHFFMVEGWSRLQICKKRRKKKQRKIKEGWKERKNEGRNKGKRKKERKIGRKEGREKGRKEKKMKVHAKFYKQMYCVTMEVTGTHLYLRWMRLSFCHSAETNDWFIEDVTVTIAFNIELPKRLLGWRLDPGITRVLTCCRLFFSHFVGSTWSQLWHSFCIAVHVMTQSTNWVFFWF